MAKTSYATEDSSFGESFSSGLNRGMTLGFAAINQAEDNKVKREEADRLKADYDRTVDVVNAVNAAKLAGDFGPATAMASKWIGVNGQFTRGEDGSISFNVAGQPDEAGNVTYTPGMRFDNVDQFQEYAIRNYASPKALVDLQKALALDSGQKRITAELSPETRLGADGLPATGVRAFDSSGKLVGFKPVEGIGATPGEMNQYYQSEENKAQAKYAEEKEKAAIAQSRAAAAASGASAANAAEAREEARALRGAQYFVDAAGNEGVLPAGVALPEGARALGVGKLGAAAMTLRTGAEAKRVAAVEGEIDKRLSNYNNILKDVDAQFKDTDLMGDPFLPLKKGIATFNRASAMMPAEDSAKLREDWGLVESKMSELNALEKKIKQARNTSQREALQQQYNTGLSNVNAAVSRLTAVGGQLAQTPRRTSGGVPGR